MHFAAAACCAHMALFVAGPMALIDRNFQGFGKELFTDAGKYVIHFGDKPTEAASQATKTIQAAHPDKPAPPVTAVAKYRNPDMQIIATSTADQLVRPSNVSQQLQKRLCPVWAWSVPQLCVQT